MSTPDLHARAARFFLLAEQASRLPWRTRTIFWETSVSLVRDPTAHLPALAAAVRKEYDNDAFLALALHPLPGVLPPEAVPWYDAVVAAWETCCTSRPPKRRRPAQLALVRLEGCGMPDGMERPSRLPELLDEAREIANRECRAPSGMKLETLAALADWRPAPRVITPPETLREWGDFWQEIRRSKAPLLKGIAARALLNLPEADLRAASLHPVPPEQRLRDLAVAIPAAAQRTARSQYYNYLPLLDWQPVKGTVGLAAEAMGIARSWLKVTSHNDHFCRRMAWQQLVRWDQAGSIAHCGIDLLPFLVEAAQTEKDKDVLWEMARWKPATEAFTGTEKPDRLDLLRQLETAWQRHRQSWNWWIRTSAWLAGIRLHQAGLASEPPAMFREAYLSAVVQEGDREVLLVLAQWSPGAEAPAAFHQECRQVWQHRLLDEPDSIRQTAAFALLRQVLENETGEMLRRAALEGWRTGTKEGQATRQILDAALSRFHEVQAQLAAGSVPDFEKKPVPPAQRQYPRLALPPGRIADREWKMENGELKMENHEGALAPGNRPAPDGPSR